MKGYIRTFGLTETDGRCDCGHGREYIEQVKFQCQRVTREEARDRVANDYGNLDIMLRNNNIPINKRRHADGRRLQLKEENYWGKNRQVRTKKMTNLWLS